jgi:hypothetical protein
MKIVIQVLYLYAVRKQVVYNQKYENKPNPLILFFGIEAEHSTASLLHCFITINQITINIQTDQNSIYWCFMCYKR